MPVIREAAARRTTTPNATLTTFASPTQGGSTQALWRVEMAPDAQGPLHAMSSEQIWIVLDGSVTVQAGDERFELAAGDTAVLAAGLLRQFTAGPEHGVVAVVTGEGGAVASGPDRDPIVHRGSPEPVGEQLCGPWPTKLLTCA